MIKMPEERLTTVVIGKIHISEWIRDEFESRIVELLSFREKYRKPQKKDQINSFGRLEIFAPRT